LARDSNLPKVFLQGEKSGDFLSDFLKKYDSYLVERLAYMDLEEERSRLKFKRV
jgi:hypothetical protein